MALYWKNAKVALDIIDDPQRHPAEVGDDWTVIKVKVADLADPESYDRIVRSIVSLVDDIFAFDFYPNGDDYILLTNSADKDRAHYVADLIGMNPKATRCWDGPIPPIGSYKDVDGLCRMSTPEFFFLRMSNTKPRSEAVKIGMELCSTTQTSLTCHDVPEGESYETEEPPTSVNILAAYLSQCADTIEGARALSVLSSVSRRLLLSEGRDKE